MAAYIRAAGLCLVFYVLHSTIGLSVASPVAKRSPDDEFADKALANVYKILEGTLSDGSLHTSSCTKENVAVRKEYGDMSISERDDYVRAVNCLIGKPSKLSPSMYPGAKTRYDDFVVLHMNMTPSVHNTANFLHWHRYYIWAYESALRGECDYKGYQPYWNWGKYPDPTISPIFNGDDHSMGGNGEPVPHQGFLIGGKMIPPGKGGGCVKTGPFKNMTINLGPRIPTMDPALNIPANPRPDGYGYNPRCLRRDVNDYFTSQFTRPVDIAAHITSSKDIEQFQNTLQRETPQTFTLHTSGHYSIWGDPGGDVYVSPSEPTFWLHHGGIDWHWWVWQNQDPQNRVQQYKGGTDWKQPDTSPPGKLTDVQELAVTAPAGHTLQPSKNLVSSTAGPFCYIYK